MTDRVGARRIRREEFSAGWKQEVKDLLRGVAGGAIIGMPLLYTMEMWWQGMVLAEWHLLGLLGAVLVLNILFSLVSGLRESRTLGAACADAVTALGLAILFSSAMLWLIGALPAGTSFAEAAGKVLIESAGVSLGVAFANTYRGRSRTGEDQENGGEGQRQEHKEDPERLQLHADLNDLGATLAGATLFALNVAPTEEVLLIATRLGPWRQLALLAATVLLCYLILYASGFEEQPVHVESVFQHPLAETTMACALSLGAAFALLSLLGMREVMSHASTAVAAVVTLGAVAVVGGAAGRLIV